MPTIDENNDDDETVITNNCTNTNQPHVKTETNKDQYDATQTKRKEHAKKQMKKKIMQKITKTIKEKLKPPTNSGFEWFAIPGKKQAK